MKLAVSSLFWYQAIVPAISAHTKVTQRQNTKGGTNTLSYLASQCFDIPNQTLAAKTDAS